MPQMVTIFDPQGDKGEVPFEQYHAALQAGAKPAVTVKSPSGQTGEIPYERLGDALKAGAQWVPLEEQGNQHPGFWSTLGSDLWNMVPHSNQLPANLPNPKIAATVSGGQSQKQFEQEQASRKAQGYGALYRTAAPIGQYGLGVNVPGMEQSAAQGDIGGVAGHAAAVPVAMAATEGVVRGAPVAMRAAAPAVRTAGKIIEAASTPEIAGRAIGGTAGGIIGNATKVPHATVLGTGVGEEIGGAIGRKIGNQPLIKTPKMQVYGYGEPAPGLRSVPEGPAVPDFLKQSAPEPQTAPVYRDATRSNVPFAGEDFGPMQQPEQPSFLQAKAYRARDVGEQGISYNQQSHAQATLSRQQAETFAQPGQRDAITGKPQEVVSTDLDKAPGFSVVQNGGNPPWVKFHGEVPESAINTEVPAPDFLNTKKAVDQIGEQINQGMGNKPIQPNVPLRQQGKLPQGFTSHESSALSGSKFNPQASELEIATPNGHYIYGEVTPEVADNFANAESKGKAWGEIKKNHPLVAKVINGKRVSVNPARK